MGTSVLETTERYVGSGVGGWPLPEWIAVSLDLTGLSSPLPVVKAAREIGRLAHGDLLEVLAKDSACVSDFAAWCRSAGHVLLETSLRGGVYRFVIEKR